jgi:poly(ADP-ribose) glycohydrolase
MVSPESIVGMLFLPTMRDNESIEIVGAETYSQHVG